MQQEYDKLQENLRQLTDDQRQADEKHTVDLEQVKEEAENKAAQLKGDSLR